MARFRRTFLGLLAALMLMGGYGWTVAALACPETIVAVSKPVEKDDGCGPPAPHGCAIPYCGPVCIGVTPAVAAIRPMPPAASEHYRAEARQLPDNSFGPEPPPPRIG